MEKSKPIQANKQSSGTVISLQQGKLPPQAIELEEAVLGAMLIDKKGVDEVIDLLEPEAFYKTAHQNIFESIFNLFQNSQPIDLLTVSADLRKNGKLESIGGDYYLVQLTQKVASSAHIEFHARIILQKYIQRSLIRISNEIIESSYKESIDVFDLLDEAESKLYDVAQGNVKKSSDTAQNLVMLAKKKIEEIANKEGLSGVATGFEKLDLLTSGWQPSDLIIIAARPGMGKTALTLSMARNMAVTQQTPVAFFSLEMSSVQLITRLISAETGLSSEKLRTGKLADHEWKQLNVKVGDLEKAPLFIDDTPSLSVSQLASRARRLKRTSGLGLIVVDYLQLLTPQLGVRSENRVQEISNISRTLKAIAKDLNVPVVALSQLSRAVEMREDKRPNLADLRESVSIEQDADVVMFVYREEYYLNKREPERKMEESEESFNIRHDEWLSRMQTSENKAEVIVAKQRHGPTGAVQVHFEKRFTHFTDLTDASQLPERF